MAAHLTRVLVQLGMAGVLLPEWGLKRYGDWLILVGIAVFLGGSDFGYLTATVNDMNLAVGRGDFDHALDVFRTVARGMAIVFVVALVVAAVGVTVVPLVSALGLKSMDELSAAAIVLMIAAQALLLISSMLLYGGFTCVGHYGEGVVIQSSLVFCEFGAACVAAVLGAGPVLATAALLGARVIGTVAMYIAMRRRAPWLTFGRPAGQANVRKRLSGAALASASIGWATALNIQLMVIIIGVTTGPESAAIFGTVRTLSRLVLQITGSISQSVAPELGKAFARGETGLVERLQRRITQAAVWSSVVFVVPLAVFGSTILGVWTSGRVEQGGLLLDLLLVGACLESAWITAGSILIFTNRHQRIGVSYAVLMLVNVPLAFLLASALGRNGAALSLIIVAAVMLAEVLRQSLPAAHSTLSTWVRSIVNPVELWRALVALHGQFRLMRAAR